MNRVILEDLTFNGHHYVRRQTVRMRTPLDRYYRDGRPLAQPDWRRMLAADEAADRARARIAATNERTLAAKSD